MQYNVLLNLKHNHARYAPGSLVELDEKTAAGLIADGVVEELKEQPKPEKTEKEDNGGEKSLEDMSGAELKEEAANRDLPTSGSKADLIERIKAADAESDDNGDNDNDL
jgi:hypothetical protein